MIELRETVMVADGPMVQGEIEKALAGKAGAPEMKAVVSLVESFISAERRVLECRGQNPQARDEAAGAVDALKELRGEILRCLGVEGGA